MTRDELAAAIVAAAVGWASATEVLDEYRRDGIDPGELAALQAGVDDVWAAPLLAAVNAYLEAGR